MPAACSHHITTPDTNENQLKPPSKDQLSNSTPAIHWLGVTHRSNAPAVVRNTWNRLPFCAAAIVFSISLPCCQLYQAHACTNHVLSLVMLPWLDHVAPRSKLMSTAA